MMSTENRWLDHREAINCRGKRFDTEWTGTEHLAFGPVAYNRDAAEILALPDDVAAAYDHKIQSGMEQAQTPPDPEPGPPCVSCGKPSVRVIDGLKYCSDHGAPLPIPDAVLKRMSAPAGQVTPEEAIRVRAASGREILLRQLDHIYEPERAARSRQLRQYEALREDVFERKVRVGARWPGQAEVRPVLLDELRGHYPADPHETRVELPSLPLPMTLVFSEADILALKGTRAGRVLRAPTPRPLSKAAAVGIARQFLNGRTGQRTTQGDLWSELKQHGYCPRSVMRDVAKACGMAGRGRPRSKIAAEK